jgi:hypothetical protein
MNTVALVSFLIGLLLIGWVVLANAVGSSRWYRSSDREPFAEDHLVRPLVERHHVNLHDRVSLGWVEDCFKPIDNRKTATWLPKDQPLDTRSTGPSPNLTAMVPR